MMQIVWIVVGIGALLLLGVLGYGLFGQLKRVQGTLSEVQGSVGPRIEELTEGIRRAQSMRTQDADRTRGHGQHA